MSHLLVIELPGGNDTDILSQAAADGHTVSFLTAGPAHYRTQSEIAGLLDNAARVIDAGEFQLDELLPRLGTIHQADPFNAVLCLQDLRIVETAQIATALGLRHLNPATAALARDKQAVRQCLAQAGIAQPPCLRARSADELLDAVATIGLPALVKPADGFGSQHIFALRSEADLAILRQIPDLVAAGPGDYGLGVAAQRGVLVERLLEGRMIGCDTLTATGRHILLGIHEKLFFPPPSFAIRGGCFTSNSGQFGAIEAYVFRLLDAVGFNHGAAHVELMLTSDGPQLVEINPRLVGARLARLLDMARGCSIHADIIALHTAGLLPPSARAPRCAVSRWLTAPAAGKLRRIDLPSGAGAANVRVTMTAQPGDEVRAPFDNADRLGCVMVCGNDRAAAEAEAQAIVDGAQVTLDLAAAA